MAFSCEFIRHENRLIVPNAFFRSESFVAGRQLVDYRRSYLADDLVLRIRAARTTDCADNSALLDQWKAASRRNDSIKGEQVVEMHEVDAVLEDLGFAPKGRGCSGLVLCNLNRGKHRAIHA